MSNSIAIRRVVPSDALALRDLRLRALASDPLSFGSTYEREVTRDDAFWIASAERHARADDCAMFVAVDGNDFVGLIRGALDDTRPGVCLVHALWVAPEARRRGVARRLLTAVEEWMRSRGGEESELMVTVAAPAARSLYEASGYLPDGHTELSERGIVEHRLRKRL